MRFISTKTHGALDYLTAIVLILAPWIFNFDNGGAAQWVPRPPAASERHGWFS